MFMTEMFCQGIDCGPIEAWQKELGHDAILNLLLKGEPGVANTVRATEAPQSAVRETFSTTKAADQRLLGVGWH